MARYRSSSRYSSRYSYFPEYVSVGERRAQAAAATRTLEKAGEKPQPVVVTGTGRKLCKSWWGNAWCENLERFGDYENRLPRGRSYLRNGAVIDLRIAPGAVHARVQGSKLYKVAVEIKPLRQECWEALGRDCAGNIGSVVDLIAGRFGDPVMKRLLRAGDGLFPEKREITYSCSCPDYAQMCKHVAATLMGVAVRFDDDPALFFTLRGVDPTALVAAVSGSLTDIGAGAEGDDVLKIGEDGLGALFDIEVGSGRSEAAARRPGTDAQTRASRLIPADGADLGTGRMKGAAPSGSAAANAQNRAKDAASPGSTASEAKNMAKAAKAAKPTKAGAASGSMPEKTGKIAKDATAKRLEKRLESLVEILGDVTAELGAVKDDDGIGDIIGSPRQKRPAASSASSSARDRAARTGSTKPRTKPGSATPEKAVKPATQPKTTGVSKTSGPAVSRSPGKPSSPAMKKAPAARGKSAGLRETGDTPKSDKSREARNTSRTAGSRATAKAKKSGTKKSGASSAPPKQASRWRAMQLVTAAELYALGLSPSQVRTALLDGFLSPSPWRGQYFTTRKTHSWIESLPAAAGG